MKENDQLQVTVTCLLHAVEDTQATIRAYDTKTEILGVLLTLAIGVSNFKMFEDVCDLSKALFISSWITGLLSIGFLGMVLHPKKDIFKDLKHGTYTPNNIYFLSKILGRSGNSVSALADTALETDWVRELTYENMKLSLIREKKDRWFVRALKSAGLTFLLIVFAMIAGA